MPSAAGARGPRWRSRFPRGRSPPSKEERPGAFRGTWTLPLEGPGGAGVVRVRAFGPVGTEPARLSAWVRDGELFVGVSDLAGLPIPAQPLKVGGEQRVTGADGTVSLGLLRPGRVEVVHGIWPGLRKVIHVLGPSGPVYPQDPALVPAPVEKKVHIEAFIPVNVRLQVEGSRVTYWVEDLRGHVLAGRQVHVALSSGKPGPVEELRDGRRRFTVAGALPGRVSVSVADVQTGMTAVAEVKP